MSDGMVLERLAYLEPDWTDVERRSRRLHKQHLLRRTAFAVGAIAAAAVLAGGAYAAARSIWRGQDMTPADIARQATTVYNDKWGECDGHGHCETVTGTHTEVQILPSMGVVLVLPDGDSTVLLPTEGIWNIPAGMPGPQGHPMRDNSGNSWGTAHPLRNASGNWLGGVWSVPLPGGGTRTITWHQATGAVTATDRDSAGEVTGTTALQTGDVAPLIPGTLTRDPRTLDKAITFDLPTSNRVIIFPRLNETYIDWVEGPPQAEPLSYDEAAEYGLTPIGHYNGKLPVTPGGSTWIAHLHGGLTRTISWHAGDSFVTVEDATPAGKTTTQIPIGHGVPQVPFK